MAARLKDVSRFGAMASLCQGDSCNEGSGRFMVRLEVVQKTEWKDTVFVYGSSAALGQWDLTKAREMSCEGTYPAWRVDINFGWEDAGKTVEYKFLVEKGSSKERIEQPGICRYLYLPVPRVSPEMPVREGFPQFSLPQLAGWIQEIQSEIDRKTRLLNLASQMVEALQKLDSPEASAMGEEQLLGGLHEASQKCPSSGLHRIHRLEAASAAQQEFLGSLEAFIAKQMSEQHQRMMSLEAALAGQEELFKGLLDARDGGLEQEKTPAQVRRSLLSSRSTPATAGSDFGVSSDGDNEEDDGDVDGVEQGDAVSSTDAEDDEVTELVMEERAQQWPQWPIIETTVSITRDGQRASRKRGRQCSGCLAPPVPVVKHTHAKALRH